MNKRQAKKKEKNELSLGCLTYREDRQLTRAFKEFELNQIRTKIVEEDIKCMVELGLYTWEEAKEIINAIYKRKRRMR